MLPHDAIGTPGRQSIVEAFVCCTYRLFVLERHSRVVKTGEIAHPVISCSRHHPGVAAIADHVAESVVVLEHKQRMSAQVAAQCVPIDRVGEIDIEVANDWLSLPSHVCGRGKIRFFDVLQLTDQGLLRRTFGTRVPFEGALIDHDGKSEARMAFSFCHDRLRRLVDGIVWSVPVDDHSINAAADHVVNLALDLRGISGVITDIHVAGLPKPEHQMRVDLRACSGIEQRVDVDFADVSRCSIAVGLVRETVRRTCVVGGLSSESCGRHHIGRTRRTETHTGENDCNREI